MEIATGGKQTNKRKSDMVLLTGILAEKILSWK